MLLLNAVASHAQKENAWLRLGNMAYEGQDYEVADVSYRKAIEENTNRYEAYFNLGNALYKHGDFSDAEVKFNRASQLTNSKGEESMCHYNRGNTLLKQQKLEEAIEAYKSSLRAFPGYTDAQYNLSYAMNKLKEQQQGEQNQDDKKDKNDEGEEKDQKDENQKNQEEKGEGDDKKEGENQEKKEGDEQEDDKGQGQPKDEPNKGEQQQRAPQPGEGEIQLEEALQMLEAIKGEEKKVQAKILRQKGKGKKTKSDKEW